MNIYAVNFKKNKKKLRKDDILLVLPDKKRIEVLKYRNWDDTMRSAVAESLSRFLICRYKGFSNCELEFFTNEYGKPFINNSKDLFFNVSHSGDWVVCVIDNQEVGIDIELVQETDLNIARRYFHEKEYNELNNKPPHLRMDYFFDLWTLKESYVKAVGKGLTIPFDSFYFEKNDTSINLYANNTSRKEYYFMQYNISDQYKLAVCGTHTNFPLSIEFLDFNYIYEELFMM